MERPKIIDAEFEVVREPPKPKQWNGIGLPPEWAEWGWLARITYLAIFGGMMSLVYVGARALAQFIAPIH